MKWKRTIFSCLLFAASVGGGLWMVRAATLSTSLVATSATTALAQNNFRWYGNIDALTPTTALASQNGTITTPATGVALRLRMNLVNNGGLALSAGALFTLQYANATSGPWTDLSTSTAWVFLDNPSVADGQIIVTTVLASSTAGESYGESNPSAASPNQLLSGDDGEWDWSLMNNTAATAAGWFFRMIYASGTALDGYSHYPELTAAAPSGGGGSSSPPNVSVGGGRPATPALPIPPPIVPPLLQCIDFNGDNHVNLVDLSIMLYYYDEPNPIGGCYDLNQDGTVNFPDVSILMYYWTGD
jgi:hypothetical protein